MLSGTAAAAVCCPASESHLETSQTDVVTICKGDKLFLFMTCRRSETEADSIGMRLAAKACYDPAAAGMICIQAYSSLVMALSGSKLVGSDCVCTQCLGSCVCVTVRCCFLDLQMVAITHLCFCSVMQLLYSRSLEQKKQRLELHRCLASCVHTHSQRTVLRMCKNSCQRLLSSTKHRGVKGVRDTCLIPCLDHIQ